jgi:phosphate transport system substrate-binding protein
MKISSHLSGKVRSLRQLPSLQRMPIVWAMVLLLLLAGCGGAPSSSGLSGQITIVGSTALQPLAKDAANSFVQIHSKVRVDVYGGGSVNGLKGITESNPDWTQIGAKPGTHVDIGDSDIYADPTDYPNPDLTDHLVCVIPFSMVINPDVVGVTTLTTNQIIQIFSTGEITNWNQVGGPDLKIMPIVRPASSGTRATFRRYVLGGRDEIAKPLTSDSSTTVHDTVASTPGAIGYLALPYIKTSGDNVTEIGINGFKATRTNIENGSYQYWGYEHMYTLGDDNALVNAFIDYMFSSTVQQHAESIRYLPIASVRAVSGSASSQVPTSNTAMLSEEDHRYYATH